MGIISTFPLGSTAVKIVHSDLAGTWEFGCAFRRGKGKLVNLYTRYYLRRYNETCRDNLWEGFPTHAPDPADPSECRRVYDWIEQDSRARSWLRRKIEQVG
jgi:hypothetical protein